MNSTNITESIFRHNNVYKSFCNYWSWCIFAVMLEFCNFLEDCVWIAVCTKNVPHQSIKYMPQHFSLFTGFSTAKWLTYIWIMLGFFFTIRTADTFSVLAVKWVWLTIYQGRDTSQSERMGISSTSTEEKKHIKNSYITIFNLWLGSQLMNWSDIYSTT